MAGSLRFVRIGCIAEEGKARRALNNFGVGVGTVEGQFVNVAVLDLPVHGPMTVLFGERRQGLDDVVHVLRCTSEQLIADFVQDSMALVNDGVHRQQFFSTGSTSGKSGSLCDVSRSDIQAQWNALDLPVVVLLPGGGGRGRQP